jgi:ribosomal protein S18 acetylase RimI-like enzyme
MNYYKKYLKYKNKYLELKNFLNGGTGDSDDDIEIKFVSIRDSEFEQLLIQSHNLTKEAFGPHAYYTTSRIPPEMSGIVVYLKAKKLIGILFIEDEFNYNKKLLWWGGTENKPSNTYDNTYFQIRGFCVDKQYRSDGIGKKILNFAKKLGKQNGFNYMFATIDLNENTERVLNFYKQNDFHKYERRESQPMLNEPDTVVYISDISKV